MEAGLPETPILGLSLGLFAILVLVLVLPFISKKVEENLEPFFLLMGLLGVALNYYYQTLNHEGLIELGKKALTTPVMISGVPIGITQVVLIFGLIFYYFHPQIYGGLSSILKRTGFIAFTFIFITILGLISSLISVIVTAVILSEIAAAIKMERSKRIEFVVLASFAVGLGAALTPVGEPLSTIAISKLQESFDYLLNLLGAYIIPGVIFIAGYTAWRMKRSGVDPREVEATYTESFSRIIERTIRVYVFIAALELLGHSFTPLVYWYFSKLEAWQLFWLNTISAVVDNATLTAAEISPVLTAEQIRSALLALLISGGMLIPGNIPNIVAAGRLKITSREWARVGVPFGLALLFVYFVIVEVLGVHVSLYDLVGLLK
ncbi:MAG: DUF1646 family protein [Desulfurococcales archaeon]|nr:DUF1646 family protein [Desulfurococcales archaeon]